MNNVEKIMVKGTDSIKETMRIIDRAGTKTAIVVDKQKKLCGVVTDGDIRRGILEGVAIEENVSKIMNPQPIFDHVDPHKEKIIEIIKREKITGIPLVDDDNVVKEFAMVSDGVDLYLLNDHTYSRKHLNRILVIGGAGYIGSILTRKLLAKGYKVNILDMMLYGEEPLKEIEYDSNLRIIKGDTRHMEDVTEAIQDVDAVVHLAELVGDPACSLNPKTTQEINYIATGAIATICKHFQINRLVYASSCSVYGASQNDERLTEESSLNPVSLYAKMKIAAENALIEIKDSNFRPTILRLGTVFGYSYRPRFDLVVNHLTAKALKNNEITIFGGNQWRPNVHVEDVVDTIIATLEAPIEKVGGEIFNVGSEENNYTINQIGELIKEAVSSAEIIVDDENADRRDYKVAFGKLENVLRIKLKKSLQDGVREIIEKLENDVTVNFSDKRYSNIKFLEDSQHEAIKVRI